MSISLLNKPKKPLIAINYKTYLEATGKNALKLSKEIDSMAKQYKIETIVIPQTIDICKIMENTSYIGVYAQHVDNVKPIKNTGKTTIESLKEAGVKGILLNHSEDQQNLENLEELIKKAKLMRMRTIVCAQDINQVRSLSSFTPDFIAYEPPELIGTDKSLAEVNPNIIEESVKAVYKLSPNTKLLIGAGIKTRDDLNVVINKGAHGVLVSTGIVKAKNPDEVLLNWMQGWYE